MTYFTYNYSLNQNWNGFYVYISTMIREGVWQDQEYFETGDLYEIP